MLVLGLVLVVLGVAGGALAVQIVLAEPVGGSVSLDLVGIPVEASGRSFVAAVALLGVIATLFIVIGISLATSGGRRERRERTASGFASGFDTRQASELRLWEVRMEELKDRVGALERQNEQLLREQGIIQDNMRVHRIVGSGGRLEALIVLPDVEGSPGPQLEEAPIQLPDLEGLATEPERDAQ